MATAGVARRSIPSTNKIPTITFTAGLRTGDRRIFYEKEHFTYENSY
jgi:hypothetical protein